MTKSEKQNYLNKKTIGYWCDWFGVEFKGIEYGINDYAIVVIQESQYIELKYIMV